MTPVIAGSTSVVILLGIAIIIVIIAIRRKRKGTPRSNSSNYENTVQMAVFKDKVNRQKITKNASTYLVQIRSDDAISKEFQEMLNQKQQTSHDHRIGNNIRKHTSLKTFRFCSLPGFSFKTEYFCSAHPTQDTVKDFLSLIVNSNVKIIIVLLCKNDLDNLLPYWPMKTCDTVQHGDFSVRLENQASLSNGTVRELILTKEGKEQTVIKHYLLNLTGSETNAIFAEHFINFVKSIRMFEASSKTSLRYIHCSNGVYWSGLYAAVDIILQTINAKSPVNIPQVVANLRKADSHLFQTEDQYQLLHKCIRSFILSDLVSSQEENNYEQLQFDKNVYEELP
uniref:Receptor-type tyrosine-protein phosphatase beta-like n=1 Tax=Crassostrea virginica TaxID=6565 RepID=A0A8B8ANZ7_CRAVI|nr:receptor-type tyrosine-protein phosphatase beta-like [Crassostrea virginica]